MSIIFVPIYLRYLGIEAYGLLGLFVSLKLLFEILNVGLGATTNREVALRAAYPEKLNESRNILRTLEVAYTVIGLVVAVTLCLSSHWIAAKWIISKQIPQETVRLAVIIYGITLALQWRVPLYTGVLRGLEQQVLLNKVKIIFNTFSNVCSVLIIVFISHTITAFLLWQLAMSILEVSLNSWFAWRGLKSPGKEEMRRAVFDIKIFKQIWRFTAGMSGISVFALIFKQADKLIMSKLLPLESVGYYNTANSAVGGMDIFVDPVSKAIFPRFTAIISKGDTNELASTYHKASQIMTFVVAPLAGALIFFSYEILLLWTQSQAIASNGYIALSILAFAMMMRAVMSIVFALHFASALTWIPLWNNFMAATLLVPLMYIFIKMWGVAGGAITMAFFYTASYIVIPPITHRYVLKGSWRDWIFRDTLPFIIISLAVFGATRIISNHISSKILIFLLIFLAGIIYAALALTFSKHVREYVKSILKL